MSDTGNTPQAADYSAFASSPLWDLQRQYYNEQGLDAWANAQVPHYVTSHPVMAKAYAQMVMGFWRDLKAQGLTGDQPLYIIELGSGCGRFAYHFLLQFFEAFDAIRGPDDRVCYVMTDFSARTLEHWRERLHGRLDPFIQQGRLDFALFDVESDSEVALQNQGITLTQGSLTLPPVVIANYVLGSIRQDLFFLDKERLYEGWLKIAHPAASDPDQPFAGMLPDYQKRRITEPGYTDPAWNRLIEDYARHLPPCALLFPAWALNALERLSHLHGGNLLLLSADRGSHERKDLARQQAPDFACHGALSLPVNYSALADVIRMSGGSCWTTPRDNGLAILAACWRPAATDGWRETASAAQQTLQAFTSNDFYRVKQVVESKIRPLGPSQLLAFLRLAHWDTKVFYLLLPHVSSRLTGLSYATQEALFQALEKVWHLHLPIGEDYDLAFDLGSLAAGLNRWSAAIGWFEESLRAPHPARGQTRHPGSAWFNLGVAHWQLAAGIQARTCMLKALELTSNDQTANDNEALDIQRQLTDLDRWQARCQSLLGAETLQLPSPSLPGDRALYASLLGPHQAAALYRLQRHPELCQSAGVERLRSIDHARDWLRRQQSDGTYALGILHPDLGLIGVAALELKARAMAPNGSQSAGFYYWIGKDCQNRGYGLQAMTLLHQLARSKGVQHLFATVGQTNISSQRILAKLGYRRLAVEGIDLPSGCHYHHFGQASSEEELRNALDRFLIEQRPDEHADYQ